LKTQTLTIGLSDFLPHAPLWERPLRAIATIIFFTTMMLFRNEFDHQLFGFLQYVTPFHFHIPDRVQSLGHDYGDRAASLKDLRNPCTMNHLNFQLLFINSTRLFIARSSSVSLDATGFSLPQPVETIR